MKPDEISVYFAAAVRGDRSLAAVVHDLIYHIIAQGFIVLDRHVAEENPRAAMAKNLGIDLADLTVELVEKTDINWVNQCKYFIIEFSGASTGAGRELGQAMYRHLLGLGFPPAKILCLYRMDRASQATPMITGMTKDRYPDVQVEEYRDTEHAKGIINNFLGISKN